MDEKQIEEKVIFDTKKIREHVKKHKEAYVIGAFVGVVIGYEMLLKKVKAESRPKTHKIAVERDMIQSLLDRPRGHIYWPPQADKDFGGIELHIREKK